MIRPGGSLISLSSSLKNLNQLSASTDHLDERILFLMPSIANRQEVLRRIGRSHEYLSTHSSKIDINRSCLTSEAISEIAAPDNNSVEKPSLPPVPDANTLISTNLDSSTNSGEIQVYFRRWIILFSFCLISGLNAFQWITYSIIQDLVIVFYNQSLPSDPAAKYDAVNWFSMVYMLSYIPLVFPAMFLLDRKGLRLSVILGALLTAVGSCIKIAGIGPNLFLVAMLGQTVCAIAQSFTLGVPARLSALWFGPTEIATATSIGVFGNQLGAAVGFLIPPYVVVKSDSLSFMQHRFYYLFVTSSILCLMALIIALLVIKDQPDKPPSQAQLEIRNINNEITKSRQLKRKQGDEPSDLALFKNSLVNLFKNCSYVIILISYGINTGAYYSISTLLNQVMSQYYENENEKMGLIGLILVLSGLIGAIIGGIILDKTKAFKLTTFVIYACSFGAMVLFTATLHINIWIIFGTSFLLGFFMTGYLPVGFELAAEVTYPESEGTTCGLLNTSAQIFGIAFIYIQGRITTKFGALYGNIFLTVSLLIGTILTGLVKADLRRQRALNMLNNSLSEKNENHTTSKPTSVNISIRVDDYDSIQRDHETVS